MSRAERGWDGPAMFRCALCRGKGHTYEDITHCRIPLMTLTFQTPESARGVAEDLENAGASLTLRGHTIEIRDYQCTPQMEHIERNPYLNEDGSEKPSYDALKAFAVSCVAYAAATLAFNLMFRHVFPAVYELQHTCDACAFVNAWFESVFGNGQ